MQNFFFDQIILIDDEEATLFYHTIMAEEANVSDSILTARNGESALEILHSSIKNKKRTLVFLDINMPAMNGWEVLDNLINFDEDNLKSIYIYMASASEYPADIEKIKRHPLIRGYIIKPINAEKIIDISNVIKQENQQM